MSIVLDVGMLITCDKPGISYLGIHRYDNAESKNLRRRSCESAKALVRV